MRVKVSVSFLPRPAITEVVEAASTCEAIREALSWLEIRERGARDAGCGVVISAFVVKKEDAGK